MAKLDAIIQQFLETVENQLKADKPIETRQTLERLIGLGYTEQEAKKLIAQCVASEMFQVMESNEPYNEERYVAMLKKLPKSPEME